MEQWFDTSALSFLSICLSVGQQCPGASATYSTRSSLPLGQKEAKFLGLIVSSYRGGLLTLMEHCRVKIPFLKALREIFIQNQ